MKTLIKLVLLFFSTAVMAQQPTVVVGQLSYAFDWSPNEPFQLFFQNNPIQCNIDSFTNENVKQLLLKCGVKENKIIYIASKAGSSIDKIEIFFAYEGTIENADRRSDLTIMHSYYLRSVTPGYGIQSGMIVPTFNYIDTDSLRKVVKSIVYKYPIRSFYIAWSLPELPFLVLASGITNGVLADMRHLKNSYRLVPYFKEANFQIIHYRDEQNVWKVIRRPSTGW